MRVLELLAFAPLSAPQLASALHAQPRTVRRVLARLVEEEYVTFRDGRRRLYEPTMRLVALAGQVVENSSLARIGRPYVELLHARTGATAHLVVPSYQSVLCLLHASPESAGVHPHLRELLPAHCTAGGKALLAWRDRWRESILAAGLKRYTRRTTVDAEALRRTLERVREDGHATEDSEYQPDARAIAVPVIVFGEAVAALGTSGRRIEFQATLPSLLTTARDIAADLEQERARG